VRPRRAPRNRRRQVDRVATRLQVIKSRTRPHRLMTTVPSTAKDPARPGRGTEAAPECGSLQGWPKPLASAALEPALIVADRKNRLEFLDAETIANRRSWIWLETVRFLVSEPNPGCDRAIERTWSKDRCTRRNPPKVRTVCKSEDHPEMSVTPAAAAHRSPRSRQVLGEHLGSQRADVLLPHGRRLRGRRMY
jgi:hypothetical protein